jgi:MYXO-CTERM domain-containing protein
MSSLNIRVGLSLLLGGLGAGCGSAEHSGGEPVKASVEAQRIVERLVRLQGGAYLGVSAATGFSRVEGGLRPAAKRSGGPVEVTLPERSDGAMRLRERRSGVEVAVRIVGGEGAAAEEHDGYLVYPGKDGQGTLLKPLDDGAEDHHWFPVAPAREEVRYEITLGRGASGLRLVSGVLEVLDHEGVPQLRAPGAALVGADGRRYPARLEVEGCAVDRDPRAPWLHPRVEPGAERCTLVVRWGGVPYPAALDPAWKDAGTMMLPRKRHGAVLLPSGDVLVAGGTQKEFVPPDQVGITEIYHPPPLDDHGTKFGKWATTGTMPTPGGGYEDGPLAPVGGGQFLIATGSGTHSPDGKNSLVVPSSALYDAATGTWTAMPDVPTPCFGVVMVGIEGGTLLIGGLDKTVNQLVTRAQRFDAATQSWSQTAPVNVPRWRSAAVRLDSGQVLVAGGDDYGKDPQGNDKPTLQSTEIYDPKLDSWTLGPPLTAQRSTHTLTRLQDKRVLITGGRNYTGPGGSALVLNSAEVYDPGSQGIGTITPLVDMTSSRSYHRAARLADGRVLITAGDSETEYNPTSELYDAGSPGSPGNPGTPNQTTLIVSGVTPRDEHVTIALGGMKAMSCGGSVLTTPSKTAELFDLYPQGAACKPTYDANTGALLENGDSECLSNHCVDGVCCDTACDGECRACTKLRRGDELADGTCGPIAAGGPVRAATDLPPLPADDKASCQDRHGIDPCSTQGTCNGMDPGEGAKDSQIACVHGAAGLSCGDGTQCAPPGFTFQSCDGVGHCVQTNGCGLYAKCAGPTACATGCVTAEDCVAGALCTPDHTCQIKRKQGETCTVNEGCETGHCADGVCCNEACQDTCRACSQGAKGGGVDGTCENVTAHFPSAGRCEISEAGRCGTTGFCDGKGGCEVYDDSTPCGEQSACGPDVGGTFETYQLRCHATQCVAATTGASCGMYRCDADAKTCATSCVSDKDCIEGALCNPTTKACVGKAAPGTTCTKDAECGSGVCADGVCCTTHCDGQCEACNVATLEGTCVAIEGAPRGGRAACAAASGGNACSARRCDGVNPKECAGYVADEQSCAAPACSDDHTRALSAATCAGNGACREPQTTPCAPFLCAANKCLEKCASDADCARGNRCDSERCVSAASCDDATHLRLVDGAQRACAPYRCDTTHRTCLETCQSSADCAPGSVCSGAGRCEAPSRPDAEAPDAGCSCRVGGSSGPRSPAGLALAAVILGAAIRRRQARRARLVGLLAPLGGLLAAGCHQPPAPEATDAPAPTAGSPGIAEARAARERIDARFRPDRSARASRPLDPGLSRVFGELSAAPLPPSAVESLALSGGRITPIFRADQAPLVALTLPASADGEVTLEDRRSGLSLRARALGAEATPAQIEGGYVSYASPFGPGTRLIHRPAPGGTEDYVLVEARGLRELSYAVELGERAAGLRLVAGSLEVLDPGGAPRLRVSRPYVLAAGGRRVDAELIVEGCAVDRSPAPPWGRPVTAPGATSCVLRVRWPELDPPFLVDPNWNSTGDMATTRAFHTSVTLADQRVLVSGGAIDINFNTLRAGAELYDQPTGTWASVDDMHTARVFHGVWQLKSGQVLASAGRASTLAGGKITETLDLATGHWTEGPTLPAPPRYTQANGVTKDGKPFFCGGFQGDTLDIFYKDAYVYDEAAGAWQEQPGSLSVARRYHLAFPLPDGRLLIAAGKEAIQTGEALTTTTEYFDSDQGTFSPGPDMKASRYYPGAALTPDGILFAGGITDGLPPLQKTVEFLDFSTNTFVSVGVLSTLRAAPTATWVPQIKRVLVAGGGSLSQVESTVESVDPKGKTIQTVDPMIVPRALHTAVLLSTGQVLVSGGGNGNLQKITDVYQSAELFGQVADGTPCKSNDSCGSGHCVDGVCCKTACNGFCEACSAARKGSGVDGVCEPISAGQDPDGECPIQDISTCGLTGACDGAGACARYPDGAICQDTCEGGQEKHGTCKSGACLPKNTPCGAFACDPNLKQCFASCTTTSQCAGDAFCDKASGKCVGTLPQGSACDPALGSATCATGFCVEGVCCQETCTGGCTSCLAKNHEPDPASQDGVCLPSRASQPDPHGKCVDSGAACADRGLCDGKGQCRTYQDGDPCGAPFCDGGPQLGYAVEQYACKSKVCSGGALAHRQDCGVYGCSQGACGSSCASDKDCNDRGYCKQGACLPRGALGASCGEGRSCLSGFCVDGYCCTTSCEGQCSACDLKGQEGTCLPIHDTPHGARTACPAASGGNPCSARRCDGITTTSCEGFVGAETSCHEASCQAGRQTSVALCDGKGMCGESVGRDCFPYLCGADACQASCARDADCAAGTRCQGGLCVTLASCDEARGVLRSADGAVIKECGLYRCIPTEGTCRTTCQSSADCLTGNACTAAGACAPAPAPESGAASCACSTPGSAPSPDHPWGPALLLGLLLAPRIRRVCRSCRLSTTKS